MKCEPAATAMIVEAERFGTHKRELLYLDVVDSTELVCVEVVCTTSCK